MKWIYIALGILVVWHVGQYIEQYANRENVYIIQGGVQP